MKKIDLAKGWKGIAAGLLLILLATALISESGPTSEPIHKAEGEEKVHVVREGASRAISPNFIGFNGNLTGLDRPWNRSELMEAFEKLHPGNFRYPAGTLGNYWDWDRGWLDTTVSKDHLISWVVEQGLMESSNRYPLENLAKMHGATEVPIVFMVNMLTKDLNHAIRGLQRARELGMPIRYIELGNEFYFDLPLETQKYPTPEDYARESARWIEALEEEFPDAKFAVVGGGPEKTDRNRNWTRRVVEHVPEADAITVHSYTPFGVADRFRSEAVAEEYADEGDVEQKTVEQQRRELEAIRTPEGYATMMATAYKAAKKPSAYELPEGMEVWMTEWNVRADTSALRGTWANALSTMVFYHAFLEDDRINLSCYHNLIGPLFPAILTGEDDYAHVKTRGVETAPWALSAGGLASSLYGSVMTGHTTATHLTFDQAPMLRHEGAEVPALFGWTFEGGEGGERGLIVNLTGEMRMIQLGAAIPEGTGYRQISADLAAYVVGTRNLKEGTGSVVDALQLEPHSITTLTLPTP